MRSTGNIEQSRRVVDMAKNIALLEPDAAPLTVLLKNMTSERCISPKFEWLEAELGARWDAINAAAGYAANITDIVVDNDTYFAVGDIVKVPRTGECIIVTVITAATHTLTVVRGYGETAAAALVDNDPLVIVGNANAEGTGKREHKNPVESPIFNYTQIFKTTVSLTGTVDASKLYGGKDRNWQRKIKGIEHLVDMERAFLFGERKEDTTGATPKRTTRGLLKFLTQNIVDAGGGLSEWEFESFCEDVFRYGSKKKLLLSSPTLVSVINTFGKNKLQMVPKDKTYGISVTRYLSAHGELLITKHNLFEGAVYGGYGVVIDPDNIKYRFLDGRDTKLKTDIQENDADAYEDEYITEAGVQVMQPKTHGVLTGVTGVA
ncbi:MAG: DUF5309 family protein [Clostridiaceae bacterium]